MSIEDQLRRSLADQASRVELSPRSVARWEAAARRTGRQRPAVVAATVLAVIVAASIIVAARSGDGGTVAAGPGTAAVPVDAADCPQAGGGVPSPRLKAATAADGRGVIVFGGSDGHAYLGDTWAFACGHWGRLAPSSSPPAEGQPLAAYDTDARQVRLVAGDGSVWAWEGSDWRMLAPGGVLPRLDDPHAVYDSAAHRLMLVGANGAALETWAWQAGAWERVASTDGLGRLRHYSLVHHAALARTLLFGGVMDGDMVVRDTYTWDGRAWTSAGGDEDSPQGAVTAAYDPKAKAIVAVDDVDARTWLWDGAWKLAGAPALGRRWDAGAAYDASMGGVVFFGGRHMEPPSAASRLTNDVWKWDGAGWAALSTQRD
jgi:hypothetical protein